MKVVNNRTKKIRTGDTVQIMRGKSKGRRGMIVSYNNERVIIDGAHTLSKQVPISDDAPTGVRQIPVQIHVSNVMLVDPASDRPTRAGFKFDTDNKKFRISKKTGNKV
jgi:large subunit ribosomal protein L24